VLAPARAGLRTLRHPHARAYTRADRGGILNARYRAALMLPIAPSVGRTTTRRPGRIWATMVSGVLAHKSIREASLTSSEAVTEAQMDRAIPKPERGPNVSASEWHYYLRKGSGCVPRFERARQGGRVQAGRRYFVCKASRLRPRHGDEAANDVQTGGFTGRLGGLDDRPRRQLESASGGGDLGRARAQSIISRVPALQPF
jgi:hypothetical protein